MKDSPEAKNQEEKKPRSLESRGFNLVTRGIISALFFIAGFNFSYGSFFKENPLYGVPFLAEALISITSSLVGFYIVPRLAIQLKDWFESLIEKIVSDIVKKFWEQQTRNINQKKREKQKQKADEERRKLEEQVKDSIVVDTSVLVDGRIIDIVKTGFLDKTLVIPSAVMNELHLISDSENRLKRERGRRGLDIIKKLRSETKIITPSIKSKEEGVDRKLLEFCKQHKLKLMTQDFNLNKLGQASNVKVLNINELVEAVKTRALPGEKIPVEILHEGKEKRQGIGYMADGTMIVVEEGKDKVGQTLEAKVTRVIQSPAGKIIFSEIADSPEENK